MRCSRRRLTMASTIARPKTGHHPEEVDDEVGLDAEERRAVPQRVHEHGAGITEQDAARLGDEAPALQREVHADRRHRREQRVGEGTHDQPQPCGDERPTERFAAADVADVLQPREARRGDARVDEAVRQRVELVAAPAGHHDQQKGALGGLFDDRRDDGQGDELVGHRLTGGQQRPEHELQDHRHDDRDRRTPREREHQQSWRLGFPSVQPQVGQQHDDDGHGGQHESDRGADGVGRRQQDHRQAGDDAHRDDDAERRANLADLAGKRRAERMRRRPGEVRHEGSVAVGCDPRRPGFVQRVPGLVVSSGTRVRARPRATPVHTNNICPYDKTCPEPPTKCQAPPSPRRK